MTDTQIQNMKLQLDTAARFVALISRRWYA